MNKHELNTPCFIINEKEFINNIENFHKELSAKFKNHIIGYSFKTNSLPRLLQIVKEHDCMAEVVSEDEYELAKKIGFDFNYIIYNGPIKTKASFLEAIENGSIVNVDSHRELDWLCEISEKSNVQVGVRVNFDLESRVPGQTSTGSAGGRFGFCYENGELEKAILLINSHNIRISCLHMHVSNASKSVQVYRELAIMACRIIKEQNLNIKFIDFGGGYFGGGDNGEEYRKYVDAFSEILKANGLNDVCVIVEPGASVVATAVSYLTRVIDIKDTTYGRFVFTDGTRLDIDPFMVKSKYVFESTCEKTNSYIKQVICGYTCMEKDRVMTLEDSLEFSCDDLIEYKIVGSYTMGFNNLFINFLPNVYSQIDDEFILVREKWGSDEFVRKNRWML